MGHNAELGPLDVQVQDLGREKEMSGLEVVQSLEELHTFAIEAIDQMMIHLLKKSGKKTSELMPQVCSFVATFMRPLLEKIDAVEYTQMARDLRVATDYATRLMRSAYGDERAATIANLLVEEYPEHDFVIDADEAKNEIGLKVSTGGKELELFESLLSGPLPLTIIGRLNNEA